MSKFIISIIILIATIILSIIFYSIVLSNTYAEFANVALLALVTFFLGIGIFISAIMIERWLGENEAAQANQAN